MFDDLKDKFNRFTENVEEETEGESEQQEEGEEERVDESVDEDDVSMSDQMKAAVSGKHVISEEELEDPLHQLEMFLVEHDVEYDVADEITSSVKEELSGTTHSQFDSTGDLARDALKEALIDVLQPGEFDFDEFVNESETPVTIVFAGVNGVGKTTTIAKMAKRLEDKGYSVVIANGDTYRAGANKQMEEHVNRLGMDYISHDRGGDPAAVIYDAIEYAEANDVDIVLGDTAGRLHTSDDLMTQLEKIDRVTDPDFTVLVEEAIAGQDAINRADEFNERVDIDGTILTKADADAEGGAAISIAHVTGEPVLFIGNGQTYDSLVEFNPELFIDILLGDDD